MAQLKDTTVTGNLVVSGNVNNVRINHASTLQTIQTTVEINPNTLNEEVTLFTIPAGYRGFLLMSNIGSSSNAIGISHYSIPPATTTAVLTFYYTYIEASNEQSSDHALNNINELTSIALVHYLKPNTTIRCKVTTAGVGYSNKVILQANLILQPV